jgi:hypothetical protein
MSVPLGGARLAVPEYLADEIEAVGARYGALDHLLMPVGRAV